MRHLVRAGAVLAAVLISLLVVPRILPTSASLSDFGFHPKDVEANVTAWSNLPIQYLQSSTCLSCHAEEYGVWEKGNHKTVACENCHGPAREHLESGAPMPVDTSRELCGTCHERLAARPVNFPQIDMAEMGGEAGCVTCHSPHDPRAGMPPQVPHTLEDRRDCQSCHSPHQPLEVIPPRVPHTLEGRSDCLVCHGSPELRGASLPKPPHTLEGRADCLLCHNANGIKPFPQDHLGRTSATCLNCHRSE